MYVNVQIVKLSCSNQNNWFKNVVLSFTDLDKRKLRSDRLHSGVRRPPRVLPTTRVRSLCPQLRKQTF